MKKEKKMELVKVLGSQYTHGDTFSVCQPGTIAVNSKEYVFYAYESAGMLFSKVVGQDYYVRFK